jgi:hypothetical protein
MIKIIEVTGTLSFALYVKRQTPGKEKFYGIRQKRVNELAVLKLQCMIILLAHRPLDEGRKCSIP